MGKGGNEEDDPVPPRPSDLRKHFEKLKIRRFFLVAATAFMAVEIFLVLAPIVPIFQTCSSTTTFKPSVKGLAVAERVDQCAPFAPASTLLIVVAALVGVCLLVEILTILPPLKVDTPVVSGQIGTEDVASIRSFSSADKTRYEENTSGETGENSPEKGSEI